MIKGIVVVESPAKARTINKYLGKSFVVMASYGHVRDLIPKEGAVNPNDNFAMDYQPLAKNSKHVESIVQALRKAETLYLATDPDREGEAISWHLCEILKKKRGLKDKTIHRVIFHEITKKAILKAIENPRALAMSLVNAQQARRALDYLVGFKLSPLLWKKVRRGLSAGRVQSPALRLIVEREKTINAFKKKEYWSILLDSEYKKQKFEAKLINYQDKKLQQFSITTSEQAQSITENLEKAAQGKVLISKIEKKQRKRNPYPPFITSTLQQEAARKLGFTAQRTMRLAQQLYEGIDINGESTGLITYMRTDSVTLSEDALTAIREIIITKYGSDACPSDPRRYKTKAKNAQEAHEAIRPTQPTLVPVEIKSQLETDQFKLYDLIWKRTIASQMKEALYNILSVDLDCGGVGVFRAAGSTIDKPGFIAVYQEGQDDINPGDDKDKLLPHFTQGDTSDIINMANKQHFTEPPPRFTEASLIKTLEEYEIGRPSTYASIISTLKQREYVDLDKKRFLPTDIGEVVNDFLVKYFSQYVDYKFTARLENDLDSVARNEKEWVPLLREFWEPFYQLLGEVDKNVKRSDVTQTLLEEKCPQCGQQLSSRLGKRGRFIGCTAYPECDYTRNLDGEVTNQIEIVPDRLCPKCNEALHIKTGRYGKFIGCSAYPKCKHLEPLEKPVSTAVKCPSCKKGELLQRRSRRGKIFYSCEHYPNCKYALWDRPITEICPLCQWPILSIKITKSRGTEKVCPEKTCKFTEPYTVHNEESLDS